MWNGSVEDLEEFMKEINCHNKHIKFTAQFDVKTKSVPILDMQVSIDEKGFIQTDLFPKETAKYQYLLPISCHPSHITKNIPFSLAWRLLRICSNPRDFSKRLEELKLDLSSRNYHPKIIDEALNKVKKFSRKKALEKVSKEKEKKTPLITTYHPNLLSITSIVRKHWNVMTKEDPRLKRVFP